MVVVTISYNLHDIYPLVYGLVISDLKVANPRLAIPRSDVYAGLVIDCMGGQGYIF